MKLENENKKDFYFVLVSLIFICGNDGSALDLTSIQVKREFYAFRQVKLFRTISAKGNNTFQSINSIRRERGHGELQRAECL